MPAMRPQPQEIRDNWDIEDARQYARLHSLSADRSPTPDAPLPQTRSALDRAAHEPDRAKRSGRLRREETASRQLFAELVHQFGGDPSGSFLQFEKGHAIASLRFAFTGRQRPASQRRDHF